MTSLKFPAFVVGSPRSGTSILVDAMLAAGYYGYREGNFLTLLAWIEKSVERHFSLYADGNAKVLASVVDKAKLLADLRGTFKTTIDVLNPEVPWFDKTGNPEMLSILPVIKTMWPDAVFIFAKRRAIENVGSRLKKFPTHTFEYHCSDWARNMSVWREVRPVLPAGSYIEIDQQDMIQHPDQVARSMTTLLGLPDEATKAVQATFQRNRPQQTSEGSAARIDSLATLAWNENQKDIFRRICGPELQEYGYSTNESYWR